MYINTLQILLVYQDKKQKHIPSNHYMVDYLVLKMKRNIIVSFLKSIKVLKHGMSIYKMKQYDLKELRYLQVENILFHMLRECLGVVLVMVLKLKIILCKDLLQQI